MDFQAYFEEWSLKPGERARLAVSTPHASYRAVLERLTGGPGTRDERRVPAESLERILDATLPGRLQSTPVGSYALLPLPAGLEGAVTLHCWIWPTVPERPAPQCVWTLEGEGTALSLILNEGRLRVEVPGAEAPLATSDMPLTARRWYSVAVTATPERTLLDVALHRGFSMQPQRQDAGAAAAAGPFRRLTLSAQGFGPEGSPRCPFNGKIDGPTVYAQPLSAEALAALRRDEASEPGFAQWNLAADWASDRIAVAGREGEAGRLLNGAERAVTGHNWDGVAQSYATAPEQYAALQFHEDDVVDCGWDYDLEFALPADLKSGVYAVRLEAGGAVDRYPLFVRAADEARAPVLFLVPTNTYLAYANDHLAAYDFSACVPHEKVVPADEQQLFEDPGLGRALYDVHSDGTPVRHASRRRPLVNVRPAAASWLTGAYRHFPADLYLVEWLERLGLDYHVATDEDVDRQGPALFERYATVVTGSHPEYWTAGGLAALRGYLAAGGRLMYLGGNGFYWVTSRFAERPCTIEVRRDNSGTRCWDAPYGERTHASAPELGGLWRLRGAAPNALVGIGFAAEGWGKAAGYARCEASYSGRGAAFFEGIAAERFGQEGLVLEGAVGDEVDRFDLALGSPAHAEVLATSTPLGREYQLVIEDQTLTLPDQDGIGRPEAVRSDVVYFPIPGGGAVFSVGSIACAGAIAWNGFDNDLARLVSNVLRRFALGTPP